jgi:sirohydrochlorin cobaltochelatase
MQAIVLFAHGSRDPLWHRPIQAVAARLAQLSPQTLVRCAYLELTEPNLPTAAQELIALGAQQLRVVPLFLGVGRHAREDLPGLIEDLAQAHPGVQIECVPAVGEQAALIDLLAHLALQPQA